MVDGFKAPSAIPQDLLLIQGLVDLPEPPKPQVQVNPSSEDDINSTDSESGDDEDEVAEVAADLVEGLQEKEKDVDVKGDDKTTEPADSDLDTSSSESSDSESESEIRHKAPTNAVDELDEDEDPVPAAASGTYFQTKHEVVEAEVTIPEVDQIGEEEILEKVGEVMNVMDRVVIVRGLPSVDMNRGSERALDSETLLVFDDRKVFGYIYETFGPTAQPLYQVKFNSAFPLNPERVRVGREVFHVPARSNFVFVKQIKAIKGSDASNVHDEEPGDDEIEFSDDEAEAAYRSRMKRKRGESRSRSASMSRQSTPNPTQMHDQELSQSEYLNRNAFDEHGPYDIDFNAPGPSRPTPISYDDPYGDYSGEPETDQPATNSTTSHHEKLTTRSYPSRGRGSPGHDRDSQRRGRGRGGRGRPSNAQGASGGHRPHQQQTRPSILPPPQQPVQAPLYNPQAPPFSPLATNWGYAQAGQLPFVQQQSHQQQQQHNPGFMQQPYQGNVPPFMQSPLVQPHINPRFASAWGIGLGPHGSFQRGQPMPPTMGSPYVGMNMMNLGPNPQPNMGGYVSSANQWTGGVTERSQDPSASGETKNSSVP